MIYSLLSYPPLSYIVIFLFPLSSLSPPVLFPPPPSLSPSISLPPLPLPLSSLSLPILSLSLSSSLPLSPLSPDINKFLWMVRIGGSTDKGSHIKEADYFTPQGEFRVDREGSPVLLNCLMYKLCYYRFGQVYTEQGKGRGHWLPWGRVGVAVATVVR